MKTLKLSNLLYPFLFIVLIHSNYAFSYTVQWEVGNRFRAFDYLTNQNPSESAKLFIKYAPQESDQLISAWIARRVSESSIEDLSPYAINKRGPWKEEEDNLKVAAYEKSFVQLPEFAYLTIRIVSDKEDATLSGNCEVYFEEKKIAEGICGEKIIIEKFPTRVGLLKVFNNGQKIVETSEIKPDLKIIVGLGDSYAAGEGVPDKPTKWKKDLGVHLINGNWPLGDTNKKLINSWVDRPAEWYSDRCHRSYFSSQSLTALRLAYDNPHAIVSFVHLSCAGAEVIDGVLAPQRNAPGSKVHCSTVKLENINAPRKECDVHESQLKSAIKLLCKSDKLEPLDTKKILNELKGIKSDRYQTTWINELKACPTGSLIKPDLILLQVGGNDIGFSRIIAWALLPINGRNRLGNLVVGLSRNQGSVVCPHQGSNNCAKNKLTAELKLADLPKRYKALNQTFSELTLSANTPIVISGYTNPLQSKSGALCGNPSNQRILNEWWLSKILVPSNVLPTTWQINLTIGESAEVNQWVVPKLNDEVAKNVTTNSWIFANQESVMNHAGWCVDKDFNESVGLYNKFLPQNLYKWNAYEDRTRLIRTANDSVMSQWRSNDRNDLIQGTFHPNLQGYSKIADELYLEAKKVTQ